MNQVAKRLKELEERDGIDLKSLKDNDQFIDIITQATTYAIKTSDAEKIKAFQNALINAAASKTLSKTKSHIFLSQIDRFTEWHIILLSFIDSPREWFKNNNQSIPNYMMGSLSTVIKDAFPDLRTEDELLDLIWDDLKNAGFHNSGSLKTMMSGDGTLSDRTTDLGKEFIEFITAH